MNMESAQKLEVRNVARYKKGIVSCLKRDYHMSDIEAVKAVRSSHLAQVLEENPEMTMNYPVKLWAGYVYSAVKDIDRMRIRLEYA